MSHKNKLPKPTDKHHRQLLSDGKEDGWHVMGVMEGKEGPAFAYTIGLYYTFEHPEIVIFGLDIRLMHGIVNGFGERLKKGEAFEHLDEAGDVLEGYNVIFQKVEREQYRDH